MSRIQMSIAIELYMHYGLWESEKNVARNRTRACNVLYIHYLLGCEDDVQCQDDIVDF